MHVNALKLGCNRGLVDDGPYFRDPSVPKFIEHVFAKRDSLAIYGKTEQQSFRRAVKSQPARDKGRFGNQQIDVKMKIRNRAKVFLQHRPIARQPDPLAVVVDFVVNEPPQASPESPPLPGAGIVASTAPVLGSILWMRSSAI